MSNDECRMKDKQPILDTVGAPSPRLSLSKASRNLKKPEQSDFNHSTFDIRHSTFPSWVKKYIGLDFDKANCWQLVCRVYKEQFNIVLPFLDNQYLNAADRDNIKNLYNREIPRAWLEVHPPVAGDVIVLRIQGQPWHCGVVIGNNHMLHTQKGLQAVIEKYSSMIWKQRIIGFYRYAKGMTNDECRLSNEGNKIDFTSFNPEPLNPEP